MATRTYLTGGMGARHVGESFGDDFELPADRRLRRDVCRGRLGDAVVAAAAGHRQGPLRRSGRAHPVQRDRHRAGAGRAQLLLQQPVAPACAAGLRSTRTGPARGRPRDCGRPGSRSPAARPTRPARWPASAPTSPPPMPAGCRSTSTPPASTAPAWPATRSALRVDHRLSVGRGGPDPHWRRAGPTLGADAARPAVGRGGRAAYARRRAPGRSGPGRHRTRVAAGGCRDPDPSAGSPVELARPPHRRGPRLCRRRTRTAGLLRGVGRRR